MEAKLMRNNMIETLMGAVVLAVAGFFLVFAYSSSGMKTSGGTPYHAQFDRIDGLNVGNDVRISGVKVGTIKALKVDPKTFLADVDLTVAPDVALPIDSSAEIVSDGLMGGKYLAIVPGGDDATIAPGGQITHTQSAVSLEGMIGQLIFSNKKKTEDEKGGEVTK